MFNKKLKIEVPIRSKCEKCNEQSTITDVNMTHDSVLRAFYKCRKCGHETCELQGVKFL
ncbi:hypothetical protein UT300003_32840 [Clostridium sardiniense]